VTRDAPIHYPGVSLLLNTDPHPVLVFHVAFPSATWRQIQTPEHRTPQLCAAATTDKIAPFLAAHFTPI